MTDAIQLIDRFSEQTGQLFFCDESQIDEQPNPQIAPDLRVMCAVSISPALYDMADIERSLADLGLSEIHMAEIVNPGTNSKWKNVPLNSKLEIVENVRDIILNQVDSTYYCYISKGQYVDLRGEHEIAKGHTAALRTVFLRSLTKKVLQTTEPLPTIVVDQTTSGEHPWFDTAHAHDGLAGGAPIVASSSSVTGLQIADVMAWCVTRYVRKREEIAADGFKNPFDEFAANLLADLGKPLINLLSE